MKISFDCSLDAWLFTEVEADSYEAALEKLKGMTFEELLEEGYIKDFDLKNIGGKIIERTLKVKAYDIEYDIEEDDYEDLEEYNRIINSLPTELVVEVTVNEESNSKYHIDEEDLIADEITFKTDWLVRNFRYIVIEEK
jgi:hypothetical protein